MKQQMIFFGLYASTMVVCHAYLVICRAIGKENISTIVAFLSYVVISPIAFVICAWVLELGIYSFWLSNIFQFI